MMSRYLLSNFRYLYRKSAGPALGVVALFFAVLACQPTWADATPPKPQGCSVQFWTLLKKFSHHKPLPTYSFLKDLKFTATQETKILSIAKKYGVEELDSKRWVDLVNSVADAIAKKNTSDLDKANDMAEFASKLNPIINKLPKDKQKSINFALAMQVQRIESFKPTEFEKVAAGSLKFDKSKKNPAHVSQFYKYADGYLNDKEPYKSATAPQGAWGLLDEVDLREMQAHNLWPIYMKPHDVKHVHFAVGHPRAAAVFFQAARSKNKLRYAMLSGLFEGVDTVQYSRETAIARYFKEKRNMDLEEAMIFLARASDKELEKVLAALDYNADDFRQLASSFDDWKPKWIKDSDMKGESGKGLDEDIDEMVELFAGYQKEPSKRKVLNYNIEPPEGGASSDNIEINY